VRGTVQNKGENHEHDITNNKGESVHTDRTYFTSKAGGTNIQIRSKILLNYILL